MLDLKCYVLENSLMSVCLSCNCLDMIKSVNDYVSSLLVSIFSVGFCIQSEELFSQYLKVGLYW